MNYGGSLARTEATGYGLLYFTKLMLADAGIDYKDQTVVVSGSGNVATYAIQNLVPKLWLAPIPTAMSMTRMALT